MPKSDRAKRAHGRKAKWQAKKARKEGGDASAAAPGKNQGWDESNGAPYSSQVIERSAAFDEFYRAQRIVPEAEFETFVNTLLQPLPVTFRVNPLQPQAGEVLRKLASDYNAPFQLDDGTSSPPPRPLEWYQPAGHAWHLHVARHDLRKAAALKELHQWIVTLNDAGIISRLV